MVKSKSKSQTPTASVVPTTLEFAEENPSPSIIKGKTRSKATIEDIYTPLPQEPEPEPEPETEPSRLTHYLWKYGAMLASGVIIFLVVKYLKGAMPSKIFSSELMNSYLKDIEEEQ